MKTIRKGVPGGTYKPLNEDGINMIHQHAMRLIEEVGFQVHTKDGLDYFRQAGASVDDETRLVRLPQEKAIELIKLAPSEVTLCGRDKKHDVRLGGTRVHSATGGTALYVYEHATGDRRLASLDDLKTISRLVDKLDNIHVLLLPTYPNELSVENVDVNRFFAGLENTTKHVMGGLYTMDGLKQVIQMAEIIAGSPDKLRERPFISLIACTVSPLKIDGEYGDYLIHIAQRGLPVVCPSEPLCGATSPVTLAGNVLMQTVDSLIGVMLAQLVNPGTPVIFGSVATSTDLANFGYLAGSVEMGLINAASAQMAQFYELPYYATGGMTDSKTLDSQSGYESAITATLCALAGSNFIHDSAGLMEFAMTVSYEKYVIDNDILGMAMRAVEGIRVDEETLAYDLIKEVGPGGNFVTAKHTRTHMRREHYQPTISDRLSRDEWLAQGGKQSWERARERVDEILSGNGSCLTEEMCSRLKKEISGLVLE